MKILFVSGAKVLLFFEMSKFFWKKISFFITFCSFSCHSVTTSPFRVAAEACSMRTFIISPTRLPARGKTTVL